MWPDPAKGLLVEHRTGNRGGHGFESRWSPDFFQASSFQLLKLEINCDDHSSLSSTAVVQIWIGPLHDPVTWYGIDYAGTQITQWDFQNRGKSGWTGTSSIVLEAPLRYLRPSKIYSVPCDRIVQRAYYFTYTSHHFTPHGRYELNKLTSIPMCGFIVQLVEHRTGIAEATGSNPVEALIFFRLLFSTWYYLNARKHVDSEKIRVPDGIWTHDPPWSSPMLYHWATGDSVVSRGQIVGIDWNHIA